MKFTIRFADQIVGAFIILALGILVFVVFMLGRSQRWFAHDYQYITYLNSASGVNQNMPVQYKGFTIGHVKSIKLSDDDRVEVKFTIFDIYNDRLKEGSLVEIMVSPIGLGNQFIFYAGAGTEQLSEGTVIPQVNSPEGRLLLAAGLAVRPERDDSINNIMNLVSSVLATLDQTLADLGEAIEGTDRTSLGRTMGNVETTVSGLSDLSQTLSTDLEKILKQISVQLDPILSNLQEFTSAVSDPSSSVMAILDSEGPLYTNIVNSIDSISGILRNLERTSDFIPAQLPQVAALLMDLHSALRTAQDVLVALTNNPLLKGGIPQHKETHPGGARPRDLEF
jgi:phospholipid/cholesterol/gamma-HCH transport system substrate-binding protein